MNTLLDELDARLLAALREQPRAGVAEVARRLRVARGTVQARMARLVDRGAVSFEPQVEPRAIGYPVLAFVFLEIAQGRLDEAVAWLEAIPEVLEAHGTTGPRDLLCRVAARDNDHLQEVINAMLGTAAVRRSTSYVAMSRQIALRTAPLVEAAAGVRPGA